MGTWDATTASRSTPGSPSSPTSPRWFRRLRLRLPRLLRRPFSRTAPPLQCSTSSRSTTLPCAPWPSPCATASRPAGPSCSISRTRLSKAFLLLLGAAALAQEALPSDEWLTLSLRGARVGYSHTSYAWVDGQAVTTVHEEMSVQRMGSTMKSTSDEVFRESAEGQPLSFHYEARAGSHTVVDGVIADGKLTARIKHGGGQVTEKVFAMDPEVRFPVALDRQCRQHPLAVGLKFSDKHLSLSSCTVSTVDYTVMGKEPIDGKDYWKVKTVTRGTGGFEQLIFCDDNWETKRVEFVGIGMRAERATKDEALAATTGKSEDILTSVGLPCDVLLLRPRKLTELGVRIRCKSGDMEGLQFAGDYQTAQPAGPGTLLVRVKPPALSGEATKDVESEYLAANDYMHVQDPKIVDTAKRVVGSATGAEAVRKLRNWVATRVAAGGEVAFGTDLEALNGGRGDCTERAVLLASLCRAAGIPSKLIYGFAYSHGIFIGHCWNEVRLDGQWVPADAALLLGDNDTAVDAGHLKMAETSLKDGNPDTRTMMGAFGRLETEVLDYTTAGTTPLLGPGIKTSTSGKSWTFPGLGITFNVLPGWTLTPSVDNADFVLRGPDSANVNFSTMEKGRDYAQLENVYLVRGEPTRLGGLSGRKLMREKRMLVSLDRGDTAVLVVGQNMSPKAVKDVLQMLGEAKFTPVP